MMAQMNVKCIDGKVCEICPELEIDIHKLTLHNDEGEFGTINDIYCKHYSRDFTTGCNLCKRF